MNIPKASPLTLPHHHTALLLKQWSQDLPAAWAWELMRDAESHSSLPNLLTQNLPLQPLGPKLVKPVLQRTEAPELTYTLLLGPVLLGGRFPCG